MGRWPFKWAEHLPLIIRCTAETCVKRHRGSAVTWAWTSCFFFFPIFFESKKKWEENIRWRERKVFSLSDGGTDTYASDRTIKTGNHLEPTKKCSEGSNFYFSSQRPLFWTEYAFNWLIKLPESNKSFKCLSYFNPSTFKWAKISK